MPANKVIVIVSEPFKWCFFDSWPKEIVVHNCCAVTLKQYIQS